MGDALAVCLLQLRGFTEQDFARVHPGGSLGKKLYLRVEDLIDKNRKPQVLPEETIDNTIITISSNRLGATAVIDNAGTVLGIITDGDVRRMLEKTKRLDALTAVDIMSKNPKIIDMSELAVKAFNLMEENKITQLLVVHNNEYAGMVHLHDILREGIV
jgi:arabinose-5-phosphate isomerase